MTPSESFAHDLRIATGQADPSIIVAGAHLDDAGIHGLAIAHAAAANIPIQEEVLTLGEAGKNLRALEPANGKVFSVKHGHRISEGITTASRFRIGKLSIYNYGDGKLRQRFNSVWRDEIAENIRIDAEEAGSNIFIANRLNDSPDHWASADFATLAAADLQQTDPSVSLLELVNEQTKEGAYVTAIATPDAVRQTIGALASNLSQFDIVAGNPSTSAGTRYQGSEMWPVVGGYSIKQDSLDGLNTYPIRRSAVYNVLRGEALARRAYQLRMGSMALQAS